MITANNIAIKNNGRMIPAGNSGITAISRGVIRG
jgi:hypothetical protein